MLTAIFQAPGSWTRAATVGAFVLFLTAAGCGSTTDGVGEPGELTPGLQANGSIAYLATVVEGPVADPTGGQQRVDISAPLLPDWARFYEGLPSTLQGERELARTGTFTYEQLLAECAAAYPEITPAPQTADERAANYVAVGKCAYETRWSKPYWIPKLIADVDVCAMKLGADWRLLSEDDLAGFTESEYRFIHDTLAPFEHDTGFGSIYFGRTVWLRTQDGSIGIGTLELDVTGSRVEQRNLDAETTGLQRPVALRCIRRTDVP
jgi:hypothetical protein